MKKTDTGAPRGRKRKASEPADPAAARAAETGAARSPAAQTSMPFALAPAAAPVETELDQDAGDPLEDFFVSEAERDRIAASFSSEGDGAGPSATRAVLELLGFWVADEEYALPIVEIQEIIKLPVITELPRAQDVVLGIISLRGTIVPVVDLRRVLRLEERPATRQARILVVRTDDEPVGLLVDRVTSVVRFEEDQIEPTPRTMRRQTSELLRGVGRVGSRLIIVLDVKAVVNVMDSAP
jgi:purine-binding chemotaxis protein CheW